MILLVSGTKIDWNIALLIGAEFIIYAGENRIHNNTHNGCDGKTGQLNIHTAQQESNTGL